MLGEEESPECSPVFQPLILPVVAEEVVDDPESEAPSLILLVVEEFSSGAPVAARVDLVPSATGSGLTPPPGCSPFVWPVDDGVMDVEDLCDQISGDCSLTLSLIGRVSSDVSDAAGSPAVGVLISPLADSSSEVTPAVGYARLPLPSVDNSLVPDLVWVQHFRSPREHTSILSVRCLGGGWLGKVRSSRSVRRSLSVPWGPDAPSGTLRIARRTMQRLWGIMVFPCTTRGSSNGSGFHSQPGLLSSVVANGSTNSRGTRLLWQPFICSAMWA